LRRWAEAKVVMLLLELSVREEVDALRKRLQTLLESLVVLLNGLDVRLKNLESLSILSGVEGSVEICLGEFNLNNIRVN
jgi:hypothetical protein